MPLLKFPRPSVLLHPAVVACLIWSTVLFLYSLHLSALLLFENSEAVRAVLLITIPIIAGSFCCALVRVQRNGEAGSRQVSFELELAVVERRVRNYFRLWMLLAVIETIISGGLPLFWLLTRNGKTDFDYGIPSVHGLIDSLMLALAAASTVLYLATGNRNHLRIPVFAVLWSILIVSRGSVLVLLLEAGIVYLRMKGINAKRAIGWIGGGVLFILAFGFAGDFRSGAEAFLQLAQPTDNYPAWAPSSLLWAYIYLATPLNNLLLTLRVVRPDFNLLLPNTVSTLFPTVIRNVIYGVEGAGRAAGGALVTDALNVSTAYVGPFQDLGFLGIVLFGFLIGWLCAEYWHRTGFHNILIFAVWTEALILTVFYNEFVSLPVLAQFIWFFYLFKNQNIQGLASLGTLSQMKLRSR